MKKGTIIGLVIALVLVLGGLALFTAAMAAANWDFGSLGSGQYVTNTYELTDPFTAISMDTDTADIIFAASEDSSCRVVCYEHEKVTHSVEVKSGTLTVCVKDSRKWYEHIGIVNRSPKITVYLPESEYASLTVREDTGDIEVPAQFRFESVDIAVSTGDVKLAASVSGSVKLHTSTGRVNVENLSAGALEIKTSTGNVSVSNVKCAGEVSVNVSTGRSVLSDVECNNLISYGSTGDITLKNLIAAEKISIERDTGDVKFEASDAAEIYVETDTGDVTGTLLSDKIFITESDTGRIRVPKSVSGGRCEISTDTGDIKLEIKG